MPVDGLGATSEIDFRALRKSFRLKLGNGLSNLRSRERGRTRVDEVFTVICFLLFLNNNHRGDVFLLMPRSRILGCAYFVRAK